MAEPAAVEGRAATAPRASAAVWAMVAGASWALLCLRWFDAAAPFRPRALEAMPPWIPAAVLAVALVRSAGPAAVSAVSAWRREPGLLLVVALAVLFRLPMAWQGSAGYVTADGSLSGLMALDVRDGRAHDVFVPNVPYSGSLKAHLTAPLAAVIDPARAFALVSVLFYGAFAAATCRLAQHAGGTGAAAAAGLYCAFAPAFVTRYSLSNDGNYVEVLALGAWALVLALRHGEEPGRRGRAFGIGLLLGLAFWCHILAVIPAGAIALLLLWESPRKALAALPPAALGFVAGDLPGLLWNAANGWASFSYFRPADVARAAAGAGTPSAKAAALVADHLVVLLGYDFGYPRAIDRVLRVVAAAALGLLAWGTARALLRARGKAGRAWRLVLALAGVNLALAFAVLPYIPGNPRYLLFLIPAAAVLIAPAAAASAGRVVLAVVIGTGALASLAQAAGAAAVDRRWRLFVRQLEEEGVRWCYTDYYLATKVNFLSGQRVACSARLGPTTTEYFVRFREAVEAAPDAALIAVNSANAEKLERRLDRLDVTYTRRDLMKPVLLRLSRKVDPEELFPDRPFPRR